MAKKLFEYAILHHPKETVDANGNDTSKPDSIVQIPKLVLATDEKQVAIMASRSIPDDLLDKLEEVEIIVRPF